MISRGLARLLVAIPAWVARRRGRHTAELVEDEPDDLAARTVYVVGEGTHLWSRAFACPCGCGDVVGLSQVPGDGPGWRLRRRWDVATSLAPGPRRWSGCRSHFWMRDGRITWC